MAHSASVGSVKRNVNVAGKRLGIKKYGGEFVKSGEIILRQRGSQFHCGTNTAMGKDFTIFAKTQGFVSFRRMTGYKRTQKYVDVTEKAASVEIVKTEKPAAKAEKKAEKTAKTTAKKETAPKTTTPKASKSATKAE